MATVPIEFLKDRIYLAAYDTQPQDTADLVHFSVDDELLYNAFYHDFGPFHIGHLYRFAVILHEVLGSEENAGKAVCLYSRANPRDRANAACALCCYMVLLQAWPPHLALAPIAQADPPFMPFRDAGYAPADFILSIQDVVYAVWKAKEYELIDLRTFNLEEYERYERVDQGDFNEIPPHFIAFASPSQTLAEQRDGTINYTCKQVLDYFVTHGVQLVVRLNSFLYDRAIFEDRGIKHIDLVFDDGTCPTMDYVKAFVGAVEGVIKTPGAKVAVHCKAGLGRTGCLIGAHLIYTYGFTAQEAIAYMRFMRPGMVVGPQQHWLYLHQNDFRGWRRTMTVSTSASEKLAGYCPLVPKSSLRNRSRVSSGTYSLNDSPPKTPERSILREVAHSSALPVPTPGQPRKGSPIARQAAIMSAKKSASRNQQQKQQIVEELQNDYEEQEDPNRRESVYHDAASHPSDSINQGNNTAFQKDIYEKDSNSVEDTPDTVQSSPHRIQKNASSSITGLVKRSKDGLHSVSKSPNPESVITPQKKTRGAQRSTISGSPNSMKNKGSYNKLRQKGYSSSSAYNSSGDNGHKESYPDDNDEYQDFQDNHNEHPNSNMRGKNTAIIGYTGQGTNSDEDDIADDYNMGHYDYGTLPPSSLTRHSDVSLNNDEELEPANDNNFQDPDSENNYYNAPIAKASFKRVSRRSSSPVRRSISASSSPSRRLSSQFVASSPSRRPSGQFSSSLAVNPSKGNTGITSSSDNTDSSGSSAQRIFSSRASSQRQQFIRVKKLRSTSGPIPVEGGIQVTTTTMTETTEFMATPNADPNLRHISRTPSGIRKTSGNGRGKR